jgi:hypothetical protein
MKKLLSLTAAVIGLLSFASPSQAQIITWAAANNITGNTDIVVPTIGTLVDAGTFYGGSDLVNGTLPVNTGAGNTGGTNIIFNQITGSGTDTDGKDISVTTPGGGLGPYSGGPFTTTSPSSAAYSDLISPYIGFTVGNTGTVMLSGLNFGDTYQVEAWSYFTGAGDVTGPPAHPGYTTLTGSTSVNLASGVGQYAIGTFTATGASETFGYAVNNSDNHAVLNAITLFDTTAAPEPSTYVLVGIGFLGLVVLRKRFARL